jgi:hypothetical protein
LNRNAIIARAGELQDACARHARQAESAELFAPFSLAPAPAVPASNWWALSGYNGGFGDLANKACGEWPVRFCQKRLAALRRHFRELERRDAATVELRRAA